MDPDLDPPRDLLRSLLRQAGETRRAASEALGKNHAYFQQYLERYSPRRLRREEAEALAAWFAARNIAVTAEALRGDPDPGSAPAIVPSGLFLRRMPLGRSGIGLLPLLGTAVGGEDGAFVLNGEVADRLPAPPGLESAPGAYAVQVTGSSMEPRYFEGETVYLHPGQHPQPGDFVVVQLTDGRALIKRFLRPSKDRTGVKLEQYNPPLRFTVPLADIRAMHRIVMSSPR